MEVPNSQMSSGSFSVEKKEDKGKSLVKIVITII